MTRECDSFVDTLVLRFRVNSTTYNFSRISFILRRVGCDLRVRICWDIVEASFGAAGGQCRGRRVGRYDEDEVRAARRELPQQLVVASCETFAALAVWAWEGVIGPVEWRYALISSKHADRASTERATRRSPCKFSILRRFPESAATALRSLETPGVRFRRRVGEISPKRSITSATVVSAGSWSDLPFAVGVFLFGLPALRSARAADGMCPRFAAINSVSSARLEFISLYAAVSLVLTEVRYKSNRFTLELSNEKQK